MHSELNRPPFGFARRHGATLFDRSGDHVVVACRSDVKPWVIAELRRFAASPIEIKSMPIAEYEALIQRLYEQGASDAAQMVADLGDTLEMSLADAVPEPDDLLDSHDDAPIIRLINALLTEAVKEQASDIHIEPFESRLSVRFRVDGELKEVLAPQRSLANLIVSRIKVMADLDIAEKRVPQDGRISLRVAGRPVDVRVSTLPSGHGERVVLRLLDKQAGRLDLKQLGMSDDVRERLVDLIQRPHGILLVTGPTGSGKTTTLYAALNHLNSRQRNIMTVEDPIEYYIDGVGQTQVNTKVEMSFARGLRAILRQDPDVVMVGEIRDLETASTAVQASLTGHLVLSTLHTNTAVGAITRLRDMGVEPFLMSSSLVGVMAQRLVRCLDPATAEAYVASASDCAVAGRPDIEPPTLYRPAPDAVGSGYRGRTGIYELIAIDEPMRELINNASSEAELNAAARQHSESILDDGWRKALAGETSLEEVFRVTRERGRV
ncbi:MAG: type II secretion system protein E [Lysobacteraceae bacterium]|nr:MAG: type II secretion system protein E [Xanthomonadaceae bacterium]